MSTHMNPLKRHVYAGKFRVVGKPYEAHSERDALLMEKVGNAVRTAPPVVEQAKPIAPYRTRVIIAETPAATATPPAAKKTYRRRDQTAEE